MLGFLFGLLTGLSTMALLPLFILIIVFDIAMFALSLGWKTIKFGLRMLAAILGTLGVIFAICIFLYILVLL